MATPGDHPDARGKCVEHSTVGSLIEALQLASYRVVAKKATNGEPMQERQEQHKEGGRESVRLPTLELT